MLLFRHTDRFKEQWCQHLMKEFGFDLSTLLACTVGQVHLQWGSMQQHSQLKESDIRPREIPAPKDSVFLADMRSRQESSKALQEPGANFLEGVDNYLRSTENSQNESHSQNHLDERMTPHLSIQDNIPMCQECRRNSDDFKQLVITD